MRMRYDKLFIVDIECTCWGGNPPNDEVSDIIEIGLVTMDVRTLAISEPESYLMQPSRSQLSNYCTDLTGISAATLKEAPNFATAINTIRNVHAPWSRPWMSWGRFDKVRLDKECDEKGVQRVFGPEHMNLSALFALMTGRRKRKGLRRALQACGLDFKGEPHRGHWDAYNAARVLKALWNGNVSRVAHYET